MDCIIKIIKGPEEGQEFHCTGAEAVVGRSPRSLVRLGSPSVSYEHAVISRAGDEFFIENLSATGTYVNDERISGKVRLRVKDQLRFGADTVARVDAVPTSGKAGSGKKILIAGVIAALAVVLILVFMDNGAPPPTMNYHAAYAKIEPWTQEQVAQNHLTKEVYVLLQEAWRLQNSGDKIGSRKLWEKLHILLASKESMLAYQAMADNDTTNAKLALVASNDKKNADPNDDDLGVALVEFVTRMARQ